MASHTHAHTHARSHKYTHTHGYDIHWFVPGLSLRFCRVRCVCACTRRDQGSLVVRDDLRAQQQRYIERLTDRHAGKIKLEAGDVGIDDKALIEVRRRPQECQRQLRTCERLGVRTWCRRSLALPSLRRSRTVGPCRCKRQTRKLRSQPRHTTWSTGTSGNLVSEVVLLVPSTRE